MTEETARVDLVVEQIQVALGEELSIKETPKHKVMPLSFMSMLKTLAVVLFNIWYTKFI